MREKSYRKLETKIRAICGESIDALLKDLRSKTGSDCLLNNTVHKINTSVLKKCHNDLAVLAQWIDEFCFKNANLIVHSGGIEMFGGGRVSEKSVPDIFKTKLSRDDKHQLTLLHDHIKAFMRESKNTRKFSDRVSSAHRAIDLLLSVQDVDMQIFEVYK
ncbi:hypothetical protein A1QO_02740 [Vibrio genomosp. F10 str. ZF-129]|uniref:Uncharacterized protein n=1 Tax=Vibrio genomosp. F10 str. ZF-129 TaxID=1187848 RepID=A0A1E5BKN1_9VIBR|nr:hypothetical protein [Vibrio genomosp. F10]OEE38315.1 hypothetical protein A1QO_02740 [Vibrio genomosp. F10 str. ZF-129]